MATYTMYTVRDENGIMLAKIGGRIADKILRDASGFWRSYKPKQDEAIYGCFEITEDFKYSMALDNRNHYEVFLWKGTLFINEDDYE